MTDAFLVHAANALPWARILIGLWLLLSAAHWIAAGRSPAPWGAGSNLSPSLLRVLFTGLAGLAAWMMATTSVIVLIACLTVLLLGYGTLLIVTGAFWADGSEKMGMTAMAGTLLIALGVHIDDSALALAGAALAGGQLALCYAIAGISKIGVPAWRSGAALTAVMASRAWGHPGMARALRRRPVAMAASWAVILAESAFPLALLAPQPWLIVALAVLFAFHLGTAVFMGLNKFPWAYAATYPAVMLLGQAVRRSVA